MIKIGRYTNVDGHRVRIYDNGGKTSDRYTVVFMDEPERGRNLFAALAMSEHPFAPQGIGMTCTAMPGRHLGRRIMMMTLPDDCQRAVRDYLTEE